MNLGVAKDQRLSLNPSQISGACGRLMCCLRYEHEFYVQSRKRFPKEGKILVTARGEEKVLANDIFHERVTLRGAEGETRIVPLADLREEMAAAASAARVATSGARRRCDDVGRRVRRRGDGRALAGGVRITPGVAASDDDRDRRPDVDGAIGRSRSHVAATDVSVARRRCSVDDAGDACDVDDAGTTAPRARRSVAADGEARRPQRRRGRRGGRRNRPGRRERSRRRTR